MKQLQNDIENQSFQRVYLLCGSERYLKLQYKRRLMQALNPDGDTMNVSVFSGKGVSESEVIALAETLPFFAEHRVILLEDTGFFKNKTEKLPEYLSGLPEYLVLIFSESEIDKRNRMYKAVQKNGYIAEFAEQNTDTLMRWVLGILKREQKKITRHDLERFLTGTGTDMGLIDQELQKLLSYTMGREVITAADIDAVCAVQVTNRIFAMVRAVSEQNQKKALELYYDLLALKEPPMRILYLLAREFHLLLLVKELKEAGMGQKEIASKAGIAPFAVKNYLPLTSRYTTETLRAAVEDFVQTETDVKTGRLDDVLSVELMILKHSA